MFYKKQNWTTDYGKTDQSNFNNDTEDLSVCKEKTTDPTHEETVVMAKLVDAFLFYFLFIFPSLIPTPKRKVYPQSH